MSSVHPILPIAGPSRLNLSHDVDQQTTTSSANTGVETSSNALVFISSVPITASRPQPKPKTRAKGKEKAPAPDDSPQPHNPVETIGSQEGSIAGSHTGAESLQAATLPKLRTSTRGVTDDIPTGSAAATQEIVDVGMAAKPKRRRSKADTTNPSSHDATKALAPKGRPKPRPTSKKVTGISTLESTALAGVALTHTSSEISPKHDAALNQNAPLTTGRKRKANNMEPPGTPPAPKKIRVTRQSSSANGASMDYEVVPQVQNPDPEIAGTLATPTKTSATSREVPASSSVVVGGEPGQRQLRRGRSRKTVEFGPVESVHANAVGGQ